MSILTTARSAAKHRRKTPTELRAELDKLTCEHTSLTGHFKELGKAYKTLERQLARACEELADSKTAASDAEARAARLDGENVALRARIQNLTPFRDLQPIGPVTRVVPLFHAPFAAVVDPGQISDDTTVEIPVLRLPAAS